MNSKSLILILLNASLSLASLNFSKNEINDNVIKDTIPTIAPDSLSFPEIIDNVNTDPEHQIFQESKKY